MPLIPSIEPGMWQEPEIFVEEKNKLIVEDG